MVLLATLISALLYGLAFPPLALRPVAWIALVPFMIAVRRSSAATTVGLAWAWSIVASSMTTGWFPHAVTTYFQQPPVVGIGLFLGVTTCTATLEYVGFALCYRALGRRPRPLLPLLAGAAWAGAELGRAELLGGDPWALIGYSQVGLQPVVQIADLAGVYGIAFVMAAANAALAELWLARGAGTWRPAIRGLLATAVLGAATLAYGIVRLHEQPEWARARGVQVAVVQGNLDQGAQWRPDLYGRNLEEYLRLSTGALHDFGPALVVWPESAMTFFLDTEPLYRAAIAGVLRSGGAQLIAGGPRAGSGPPRRYYNSVFLLSDDGAILATYDKQHLLPFAEYFPLRGEGLMRRRFAHVREFSPGGPSPPLPTVAGAAGVMICNEAMFPEIATDRVRAGAEFLVNLANDSWVGDRQFSAITFDTVVLRAIEERRYLVRASTSGPSAIVDPRGGVTAFSGTGARAVIAGIVRPVRERTVYARVGDSFALACVAAVVVVLGADARRR
jgi:apolipoprotein N-acyltransferase